MVLVSRHRRWGWGGRASCNVTFDDVEGEGMSSMELRARVLVVSAQHRIAHMAIVDDGDGVGLSCVHRLLPVSDKEISKCCDL